MRSIEEVATLRSLCIAVVLAAALLSNAIHSQAAAQNTPHAPAASASQPNIDSTLTRLYRAFSFEKGREPEWATIRSVFLSGATIVDPVQERTPPHAIGVTQFLEEFRNAVKREASFREGFAERIVATRVDQYGHIAHAYVTFEGYMPGDTTARTRGVDSIQLILAGDDWKVASFTTQFENKDLPLPPSFRAVSAQ